MFWSLIIVGSIILYFLVTRYLLWGGPKKIPSFAGKHVVITGGSQGLGLSLAKQLASNGAKICIIARSQTKLDSAKREIEKCVKGLGSIHAYAGDVTDYSSMETALNRAMIQNGAPDLLILNAGAARTGYFIDIPVNELQKEVMLNYVGCVNTIKAVLPRMSDNKSGHICFVSSAAALLPIIGYSNYSATKCAQKGLADALRNELKLYNIDVSIFYPTNIATEGFAEEEKTKPAETKEIEGVASTMTPDQCATHLVAALREGKYTSSTEFFPTELTRITSQGISPRNNILLDVILAPIVMFITPFVLWGVDRVVKNSKSRR